MHVEIWLGEDKESNVYFIKDEIDKSFQISRLRNKKEKNEAGQTKKANLKNPKKPVANKGYILVF